MAGHLPPAPGRRRRAARPGLARAHHPRLRRRRSAARAFGIWAAATAALTVLGPIIGGILVDTVGWRVAFLVNVPLLAFALWATLRHVAESRDDGGDRPVRLARRRSSPRSRSADSRSGSSAARPNAWAGPGRLDRASAIGVVVARRLPDPHGAAAAPARAARACSGSRAFASINLATFFIYGGAVRHVLLPGGRPAGRARLHGPRGGAHRPPGRAHAGAAVDPDRHAGGPASASRRFLVAGPAAHGGRPALVRPAAGRFGAVAGVARRPGQLIPPVDALIDVLPSSSSSGSGSRCVVAPLTSTLMGSVPGRFSGLGSAINNSISRVGAAAPRRADLHRDQRHVLLRVARLGARARHDRSARPRGVPAAQPAAARRRRRTQVAAVDQASIDAFHLAMLVCAGLLVVGRRVSSWSGLREAETAARHAPRRAPSADRGLTP